jgi:hypothetical protein
MNSSDNRVAIIGVVCIVLWLITAGVAAVVICVLKGVAPPDLGVKEVTLSLGSGLVGFLTGAAYHAFMAKKPDQAPEIKPIEG